MKDFFLNLWYEVQNLLMYSVRGGFWALIILLLTVYIDSVIPTEAAIFNQYISLKPYHLALYAIGGIYALQTYLTIWIKDYKREYLPRWLLN